MISYAGPKTGLAAPAGGPCHSYGQALRNCQHFAPASPEAAHSKDRQVTSALSSFSEELKLREALGLLIGSRSHCKDNIEWRFPVPQTRFLCPTGRWGQSSGHHAQRLPVVAADSLYQAQDWMPKPSSPRPWHSRGSPASSREKLQKLAFADEQRRHLQ